MREGTPTMGEGKPAMREGSPTMGESMPTMGEGTPTMGEGTPLPAMGKGTPAMGKRYANQSVPPQREDKLKLGEGVSPQLWVHARKKMISQHWDKVCHLKKKMPTLEERVPPKGEEKPTQEFWVDSPVSQAPGSHLKVQWP